MTKQLSPLEALEYLDDIAHGRKMEYDAHDLKKIIETALYDNHFYKHILNKICEYLGLDMKSHRDLIDTENDILNTIITHENKLKALEIIKKKKVDVLYFWTCRTLREYNAKTFIKIQQLTQEEFDLLKEVLKWQKKEKNK